MKLLAAAFAALMASACASTGATGSAQATPPLPASAPELRRVTTDSAGMARARADSMRLPYTAADIRFMTGMVGHHAQAIAMSRLAPSRGASPAVQRLAERIINAQIDEIVIMHQWLVDRGQPMPPALIDPRDAMHAEHSGHMMPGMLTMKQMQELDAARGKQFDRLFLQYMIQHHTGAVAMVKELFSTPGAGQDETVFRFATDVNVDQSTEIARMNQMLAELQP
ncbi:MAG TPA: DUF305 domain-containing protein [Gemmatimonadaceae bacterium]|nr:DUF305 domain-containing protein [Gemmatimonadaceae bacterium]